MSSKKNPLLSQTDAPKAQNVWDRRGGSYERSEYETGWLN